MGKINYYQKFEENVSYHVYNRTNNRELLFRCDENYRFFLKKWKRYLSPFISTRAYCLLPNHFHFQIRIREITDEIRAAIAKENTKRGNLFLEGEIEYNVFLEDQLKRMLSSYVMAFNKRYNRNGSLLQKRTRRIALRKIEKICYNLAYIHHNPIHHSMAANYGELEWCSYNAYICNKPTSVACEEVLAIFGIEIKDGLHNFLEYHQSFKLSRTDDNLWG